MKLFDLVRTVDVSGTSGTGVVAQGVVFDDGTCAMRWLIDTASTGFYESMKDLIFIHGHEGATTAKFLEGDTTVYHLAGS